MRVKFHASPSLPDDVAVALVHGDRATSLLLNQGSTVADLAAALTEIVAAWVDEEWIYVGRVVEPHLRAVGD